MRVSLLWRVSNATTRALRLPLRTSCSLTVASPAISPSIAGLDGRSVTSEAQPTLPTLGWRTCGGEEPTAPMKKHAMQVTKPATAIRMMTLK